jgi:hypothetical protein
MDNFKALMDRNGELETEILHLKDRLARYQDNYERAIDAWKTLNDCLQEVSWELRK